MQLSDRPLVSVVIPAFNARQTILTTLQSVRRQTLKELEIVVVDDGSEDDTVALVRAAASQDRRIRLIEQANNGVAAARNAGIERARAPFVAPVDADDLWRPDKLARQYRAIHHRRIVLVYTSYCTINEQGSVVSVHRPHHEGWVLEALFAGNIAGNGSSALMRTAEVRRNGGYDCSLRARDAQGCEDLALYLQLAEMGEFALIPEYLTGYRDSLSNMSSDARRMLRSYDLVLGPYRQSHPHRRDLFQQGRANLVAYLLRRALRGGRWCSALQFLSDACGDDAALWWRLITSPAVAASMAPPTVRRALRNLRRRRVDGLVGRDFLGLPDGV